MIRLYLTVEGETEKRFIKNVLADHLSRFGVDARAQCVLHSKDKRKGIEYRGGFRRGEAAYETVRKDILTWMREHKGPDCRFSTMFDLYALPETFPGTADARQERDPYAKIRILEEAFGRDIGDRRFVPYLQLHEFEALILVDPSQLVLEYLDHDKNIDKLIKMVAGANPELINDHPETAPSKRIQREIPEYRDDKATVGPDVAARIGIDALKQQCRHFAEWLRILESLDSYTENGH